MNVAEQVAALLAQLGVGHAFGVVGSGNFVVTNALKAHGVPFTAARHEGGAANMADAYARVSGKVSVLSVHQGCGLTNATTGIGEAAKSRTPMIVLTGESAASAVSSNFAMDQDGLAESVYAVSERLHSAETVVDDVVRAYRTAVNDRRTVVLNLPLDVQVQPAYADQAGPARAVPAAERLHRAEPVRPSRVSVAALAELIIRAQRPVFVAGRGAKHAGGVISQLAEHTGALLATSAVVKGLFNGKDYNLGISGGFSSPVTAELISNADLIVGFGCAMNMWTMRHGTLISPDAAVVQVDCEDAALGQNRPITLGVLGDTAETAADVLEHIREQHPAPRTGYRTQANRELIASRSSWASEPYSDLSTDGDLSTGSEQAGDSGEVHGSGELARIDPRTLTIELNKILPAERIVSIDSGNFMGYPSQFLDVPDADGFCFTQAFQAIGLGLGTAIGAALARPDRMPVLGTGDGGFHMAIAELETAVRLRLPLVCIVYNDAAYGAEIHHFNADGSEPDMSTVTFPDTDIAAIARGFGAEGVTVRRVQDLAAVREWLASDPQAPLVIDAKIASDSGAWWLAEAFKGH